jgi:hypothetical protein
VTARTRIALGAAALLAAVAGLVALAWILVERPAGEARAIRDAGRLLAFEPASVREIHVSGPAGEVRLARGVPAGGGAPAWRVTAPVEGAGDEAAVEALLGALSRLRPRAVLGVPAGGLGPLGLDPPRARVVLILDDGRRLALDLGDDHPFDRAAHARVAGGAVVLLPPGSRATLAPVLDALRGDGPGVGAGSRPPDAPGAAPDPGKGPPPGGTPGPTGRPGG